VVVLAAQIAAPVAQWPVLISGPADRPNHAATDQFPNGAHGALCPL
jgi:hypothetical protein